MKNRKKMLFTSLLSAAIIFMLSGCTQTAQTAADEGTSSVRTGESAAGAAEDAISTASSEQSNPGYDSPEAAARAYLGGFKNQDLEAMLDTFGVETWVEHTNQNTDSELSQTNSPFSNFMKRLAVEYKKGEITENILRQYAVLCQLDIEEGKPAIFSDDKAAETFLNHLSSQIKTADFSTMHLAGYIPESAITAQMGGEYYHKIREADAQTIGADQVGVAMPLIKMDGNKYGFFFETADYGGKWFNMQPGSSFASMFDLEPEEAQIEQLDEDDEEEMNKIMVPIKDTSKDPLADPAKHTPSPVESAGFDTPQEAVKAYLQGLKSYDTDQMLGAFAVENYVKGYDLLANLKYYKGYSFMRQEFNLPVVNDFTTEINLQSRKKDIAEEIRGQYQTVYTLVISQPGDSYENKKSAGESTRSMVLDMNSMKILGYIPAEILTEKFNSNDRIQSDMDKRAALKGAEKGESSVLVFELDGHKYCQFADVIKYNGKWYISELGGYRTIVLGFTSSVLPLDMVQNSLEQTDLSSSIVPIEG